MPTSGGGFEQTYNAQAGVDTKTMLIIASHATQHTNDKQEVTPALENITASPEEALGSVTKFIADGIEAVQD